MRTADRKALTALPLVVLIGALVALAGSQGGHTVGGVAVFAIAVAAAFVIQWVAFAGAVAGRTERFFDLTGSITYVVVTVLTLILSPNLDARALALAAMVIVWATRLGSFLFWRVTRSGGDDRFDEIKKSLPRFLNVWTIQGLWVSFTAAAAWAAITSQTRVPFGWPGVVGLVVWLAGFALEVVADAQKTRFRADPANKGEFISTGVWSWSRHPNYFGEILLWIGVALVAAPALRGWQYVALISPVFVTLLLTRVSGVPLLEKKAEATWGERADYQQYKKTTPVLIPRPPA